MSVKELKNRFEVTKKSTPSKEAISSSSENRSDSSGIPRGTIETVEN